MFRSPFSLKRRAWYPICFVGVSVLLLALLWLWKSGQPPTELLVSALGAAAAFTHFLYSEHSGNTDRFITLFRDFNERYDALNDDLNRIRMTPDSQVLSDCDRQRLFDYFNLCAEEYLYFKAGYIDQDVWLSWCRGMGYFAAHVNIRRLWEEEIRNGSYYGFTLAEIPPLAKAVVSPPSPS